MPMMTLGLFVFDMATLPYQQLQRRSEWRHASQNRVGQRPVYQYTGPGEDRYDVTGTLYPYLSGGRLSLDLLRNMADTGKGWPLIEGTGRMYGNWAITEVQETAQSFMRDGAPQRIDFSAALVRVDDTQPDWLATGVNAAAVGATAALAGPLNQVRNALPRVRL